MNMKRITATLLLAACAGQTAAATELYFIHGNHLGAPEFLTDPSGQIVWQASYSPFGAIEEQVAAVRTQLRLPGQYQDSQAGLYYNYFRDYDPDTGRYIQSDPIGLAGGLNTYAYAAGNPIRYADPYGLAPPWVGPAAYTLTATGGTLALYPNPATPPQVRVGGLLLVGLGGALHVWDAVTAVDEIEEITRSDLTEIERNIRKINELLEPPHDPNHCD